MATTARITINKAGIGKLLKSDSVKADLERRIAKVAAAAESASGKPIDTRVWVGTDRARATARIDAVYGASLEAEHGYLQRALPKAGDA